MSAFVGSECFDDSDELISAPVDLPEGRSLGLSLAPPASRFCSFDCVYCRVESEPRCGGVRWPSPGEIETRLANTLPRVGPVEWITISGRGEPTLHPRFGAAIASVVATARRSSPSQRVRILTNGTGAVREEVRRALDLLDDRVVRLDAAMEQSNRPRASFELPAVCSGLRQLRDLRVQSCFFEGATGNAGDAAIDPWLDLVVGLAPLRADLHTVPRGAADADAGPVPSARLAEIAQRLEARGIPTRVLEVG